MLLNHQFSLIGTLNSEGEIYEVSESDSPLGNFSPLSFSKEMTNFKPKGTFEHKLLHGVLNFSDK